MSSTTDLNDRFEFGKNWDQFLSTITSEKINNAEDSLKSMLETSSLKNKSFLDVGCGSGLFSLAARRLGAKVHSFDFDEHSVACTKKLKEHFRTGDSEWTIEQGSILDEDYLDKLSEYDVVYSWGVLHHTGNMWDAIDNTTNLVKNNGVLYISIYNDQGFRSKIWKKIKSVYNKSPSFFRPLIFYPYYCYLTVRGSLINLLKGRPFERFREYGSDRGMSYWHDVKDWVGGYPFEVAQPEEVIDYLQTKNFELKNLKTVNDMGCNEFVFTHSNLA